MAVGFDRMHHLVMLVFGLVAGGDDCRGLVLVEDHPSAVERLMKLSTATAALSFSDRTIGIPA